MKAIYSIVGAFMLVALLVTAAAAQDTSVAEQDNEAKRNPGLLEQDAPWGLVIVFAEGTTITEANRLRLEYGLTLGMVGYQDSAGGSLFYQPEDDAAYLRFARAYYGKACDPCPPITVVSAFFEPVTGDVEAALLADDRVAQLDNRNNPTFFLITMLKTLFETLWNRWGMTTGAPTGLMV